LLTQVRILCTQGRQFPLHLVLGGSSGGAVGIFPGVKVTLCDAQISTDFSGRFAALSQSATASRLNVASYFRRGLIGGASLVLVSFIVRTFQFSPLTGVRQIEATSKLPAWQRHPLPQAHLLFPIHRASLIGARPPLKGFRYHVDQSNVSIAQSDSVWQ
jgi:hypothetical protein